MTCVEEVLKSNRLISMHTHVLSNFYVVWIFLKILHKQGGRHRWIRSCGQNDKAACGSTRAWTGLLTKLSARNLHQRTYVLKRAIFKLEVVKHIHWTCMNLLGTYNDRITPVMNMQALRQQNIKMLMDACFASLMGHVCSIPASRCITQQKEWHS